MANLALYDANIDHLQVLQSLGSFTVDVFQDFGPFARVTISANGLPGVTALLTGRLEATGPIGLSGTANNVLIFQNDVNVLTLTDSVGLEVTDVNSFIDAFTERDGGSILAYFSTNETIGTSGEDSFRFRGEHKGKGGSDFFEFRELSFADSPIGPIDLDENVQRDVAAGGAGRDVFILGTDDASANGGAGGDIITVVAGEARLTGRSGPDVFIMQNTDRDQLPQTADMPNIRARITDFNPDEDVLVFHPPNGDGAQRTVANLDPNADSLETLFGPGTLADFTNVKVDGLKIRINDLDGPNFAMLRRGTTDEGFVVDERVLFQNLDPSDVALSSILIGDPFLG